jgi:nicotinamidase-related amidase
VSTRRVLKNEMKKHQTMKKEKRIWDDILTERDKNVYETSGFGKKAELGARPAIIIIDVNYEFVGEKQPILESIKKFPLSCGDSGWKSVESIGLLLARGRIKSIPVFYSIPEFRPETANIGATKTVREKEKFTGAMPESKKVVKEIAPAEDDIVIYKQRASIFFGTPLISHLTRFHVDSLLICGTTTSGCVRASVVDAFSYGFRVAVVEECTFDRGEVSHKVNLFDMHQKYANVISLDETLAYLDKI